MSRRGGTNASDPTARIASAAVDHNRATRATGWRAHYDPHRRPVTDEERTEADALGWEAWRTAQEYRAYRLERFGARA